MEVLCPNVSMDFLGTALSTTAPPPPWLSEEVLGWCLLSEEELSPLSTFDARSGSATEEVDCETVPDIFAESDCGAGWFLSHVFIIDNPIEVLFLGLPPPSPPSAAGSCKEQFGNMGEAVLLVPPPKECRPRKFSSFGC